MQKDLPEYLVRGERSRLFPVLADTSKEGRVTSITLSALARVRELAESLLDEVGQRVGKTAKVETYTEICFKKGPEIKGWRPDGLIVLKIGSREWRALVEAKVGNSELDAEQIGGYLELAAANEIDAVITISNQYAVHPTVHPVKAPAKLLSKVQLFHWSWMHILTTADLLLTNDEIADDDQRFILNELRRFLTHPSTGLKSFDSMPAAWSELVQSVSDGGKVSQKSPVSREVVEAWHQESRNLSLVLSQRIARSVELRLSRAHAKNHDERLKADLATLAEETRLTTVYEVPDAASPLSVTADLGRRIVNVSMRLRAPEDKQSTKARLNWLLRQLQSVELPEVHVRIFWPGRGAFTQHSLAELKANPDKASDARAQVVPHSFEICMVKQLGGRFGQRKNFIVDLEDLVPTFYEKVGQRLRGWQPPAPRIREDRISVSESDVELIREAAEEESRVPLGE